MSGLIILKRRIIEPNRELVAASRLQGFYKMEAVNARTGKKRLLADWFPNLITNAGLNGIGAASGWASFCKVGSGNTAPTVLDTSMQTFIASSNTVQAISSSTQSVSPYYGESTKTYRFGEGVAAGNLAEVGIGAATGNTGTLFSRALILAGGSPTTPTTITVLSDEFLDVTYQIRCYPATEGDITGTVTISGTVYNYTARACSVTGTVWQPFGGFNTGERGGLSNVSAFSGAIAAITGTTPSGTGFNADSTTNATYGTDTFFREATSVWGLTSGNNTGSPSGLQSFKMDLDSGGSNGNFGQWQIGLSPTIPKDSSKILSVVFRHTWARR